MDLDLVTNGCFIKENISSLLSGKIVWVVLGYLGNQTITVVEVGDDSLEDMFEEFHGSKIMYGFASVIDPNTKLKKNVFIYWQGSGASQVMKTKSVQHSNIIRELCKSIHVTITARDEQDLDLKDIMLKVAAASGSNYSFHNENKQIFESQPSVKSEGNTANIARQERHKELASLSNIKKDVPPIQKANNSIKPDISKHIKPTLTNKATFQKSETNYVKTKQEKDYRPINTNQKIMYESPATVKSQNNTPDRAKEERQKELSQLLNRSFDDEPFQQVGTNYTKINPLADIQRLRRESQSHDIEISMEPRVFHVSKVDPKEIIRLKRTGSNDREMDINSSSIKSSYKKIDPMSEIQELQRASKTIEFDQCVSPSSTYKKINPAEEIKNLKSQSSFTLKEATPVASNYKKVNPTEEIMAAKNTYQNSSEIYEIKSTQPVNTVNNEAKSARMTFQNIHKSKVSEPQRLICNERKPLSPVRDTHISKINVERKIEVEVQNQSTTIDNFSFDKNNHNFNNNHQTVPIDQSYQEKLNNKFGVEEKIPSSKIKPIGVDPVSPSSQEKTTKMSNTAVAIYEYQASDADEISFEVGELITEIEHIDEGWWLGYNAASIKGMFPSNYVKLSETVDDVITLVLDDKNNDVQLKCEQSEDISNGKNLSDTFLTVLAEYSYDAQDKDELSFQKGDIIYNVTKIDNGWWEGEMENGSKGMFPSNYVRKI